MNLDYNLSLGPFRLALLKSSEDRRQCEVVDRVNCRIGFCVFIQNLDGFGQDLAIRECCKQVVTWTALCQGEGFLANNLRSRVEEVEGSVHGIGASNNKDQVAAWF